MSRYVNGMKVATCVFEAAAWHDTVRIACAYGHVVVHDPHGLWWWCQRKHVSDNFNDLRRHLTCGQCERIGRGLVRPASITSCQDAPTRELEMPPEREWKRALRRMRS
jgi:hypothetical protein